jgi:hypothetical protein
MATDAAKTIKTGDAGIIASVREFWESTLQDLIYEQSISRNLAGAVQLVKKYGQGYDKTLNWTRSKGITTTASNRYDVANTDLEMGQVEYATEALSVTADHFAGYVAEKVDILRDQEGFVVPNILSSLAENLAIKENEIFATLLQTADDVTGLAAGDGVDISLVKMRLGVTEQRIDNVKTLYLLMHPNTVQTFADEMLPANTIGDNNFLRQNVVGSLFGANVIETSYIPANKVIYLARDAVKFYERMPYTLTNARDNVSDLYVKFAVEARFGMGLDRAESTKVGNFTGN